MRLLATLLTILLIASTSAQMDFTEPQQIRVAYGDIPSTSAVEANGQWNFRETRVVDASHGPVRFVVPAGHGDADATCGCDHAVAVEGDEIIVGFPEGDNGERIVTFTHTAPGTPDAFTGIVHVVPQGVLFVYVAPDMHVSASTGSNELGDAFYYPGDNEGRTIRQFHPATGEQWFSVTPSAATVATTEAGLFSWQSLIIGIVAGAMLWYLLVRQGVVQKRQRKQVASTAAHQQVAAREDKATLEGRKRALKAALKELEVAHRDQEIDNAAYDALKADFKRQTVTVMRALEAHNE